MIRGKTVVDSIGGGVAGSLRTYGRPVEYDLRGGSEVVGVSVFTTHIELAYDIVGRNVDVAQVLLYMDRVQVSTDCQSAVLEVLRSGVEIDRSDIAGHVDSGIRDLLPRERSHVTVDCKRAAFDVVTEIQRAHVTGYGQRSVGEAPAVDRCHIGVDGGGIVLYRLAEGECRDRSATAADRDVLYVPLEVDLESADVDVAVERAELGVDGDAVHREVRSVQIRDRQGGTRARPVVVGNGQRVGGCVVGEVDRPATGHVEPKRLPAIDKHARTAKVAGGVVAVENGRADVAKLNVSDVAVIDGESLTATHVHSQAAAIGIEGRGADVVVVKVQGVGAAATVYRVGRRVDGRAKGKSIVETAADHAFDAGQCIGARPAGVLGSALRKIHVHTGRGSAVISRVAARTTVKEVVTRPTPQQVVAGSAEQAVITSAAGQRIVPVEPIERVRPAETVRNVVADRAGIDVVFGSRVGQWITGIRIDPGA